MDGFLRDHPEVQLIAFTSVGTDLQTPFDALFCHADSRGGCTAREVHEMLLWFRTVPEPSVIHMALPPARTSGSLSFEQATNELRTMQDLRRVDGSRVAVTGVLWFGPSDLKRIKTCVDSNGRRASGPSSSSWSAETAVTS
jgi:hypothetical protein